MQSVDTNVPNNVDNQGSAFLSTAPQQTGHNRPFPVSMLKLLQWSVVVFLALVIYTDPTGAQMPQQTSSFRLNAHAGRWTGANLDNLPKGTTLAIEATTDGAFSLMIFDEPSFAAFPNGPGPIIKNEGSGRIAVTMIVANAGRHTLIIDNRAGTSNRSVSVKVTAFAPGSLAPEAMRRQAEAVLAVISEGFDRVFRLPDTELRLEDCDDGGVFSKGPGVKLCSGYVERLLAAANHPRDASPLLMFTIFQKYADLVASNRSLKLAEMDALAASMMVLLGYKDQALSAVKIGTSEGPAVKLLAARGEEPRYGLNKRRALALNNKLESLDTLKKWAPTIFDALEDRALEALVKSPPRGVDAALIRKEQERRQNKK